MKTKLKFLGKQKKTNTNLLFSIDLILINFNLHLQVYRAKPVDYDHRLN